MLFFLFFLSTISVISYRKVPFWKNIYIVIFWHIFETTPFCPFFHQLLVLFFFRKRCWFSFLYMHFASILWNDVAMWGLFWLQFLLLFSSLSNYWFCDDLFMFFFFNFSFIMTCLHNERLDKWLEFCWFFFWESMKLY